MRRPGDFSRDALPYLFATPCVVMRGQVVCFSSFPHRPAKEKISKKFRSKLSDWSLVPASHGAKNSQRYWDPNGTRHQAWAAYEPTVADGTYWGGQVGRLPYVCHNWQNVADINQ